MEIITTFALNYKTKLFFWSTIIYKSGLLASRLRATKRAWTGLVLSFLWVQYSKILGFRTALFSLYSHILLVSCIFHIYTHLTKVGQNKMFWSLYFLFLHLLLTGQHGFVLSWAIFFSIILVLETENKSSLVATNCFAFLLFASLHSWIDFFCLWVHSALIFYFSEIVKWVTTVKWRR